MQRMQAYFAVKVTQGPKIRCERTCIPSPPPILLSYPLLSRALPERGSYSSLHRGPWRNGLHYLVK